MVNFCSAPGCGNSSAHKVKLYTFPTDPRRHEQWQISSNITKTTPPPLLCEFHFAPHMWQDKIVDGSAILKKDAVPTIFGDAVYQVPDPRPRQQ